MTNPGHCSSMDRKVVLGLAPFRHSALWENKAWPMPCAGTHEKSFERILQQMYNLAQEQIWWSFFRQKREESLQMFWSTVGCWCWGGKSMLARAIAAETGAFVPRLAPDFGGNLFWEKMLAVKDFQNLSNLKDFLGKFSQSCRLYGRQILLHDCVDMIRIAGPSSSTPRSHLVQLTLANF